MLKVVARLLWPTTGRAAEGHVRTQPSWSRVDRVSGRSTKKASGLVLGPCTAWGSPVAEGSPVCTVAGMLVEQH